MAYPDDLLAAQDKTIPELEKEFLRSIRVTVQETDWEKLDAALQAQARGEEIVDGMAWEDFDPSEALKNLFETTLELHGEYIGSVTGGAIFDYVDPNALKWIEKYGADQVVLVTQSTKDAIATIVKYGYENGVTVRDQARLIRELVGLDPPRARTLQNYVLNLRERGVSEAKIEILARKKYQVLLNARANTIAVNETSDASSYATYQSTKSAVERGVLDPNLHEGFRIVTGDERTCPACVAVEGEARVLPNGTYPSSGQVTAKKHIKCRCVEGLREKTKGDSSTMHFDSFSFGGKIIEKTDLITVVPALLTEEGVQNRGLKRFDEFHDPSGLEGYIWFEGKPVTRGHPGHKVDSLTPKLGRIRNVRPDPAARKVPAELVLFNAALTADEMERVESGEIIGGSIGYDCGILILDETKIWEPTGEEYDFEYKGPIYGDHFAIFVDPACKRCGLNTDSKCNCTKVNKMSEVPPAQSGTEGAPAQAGTLGDGKSATPARAPAPAESRKDQAGSAQDYPNELITRAQTVLGIADEYIRGKEAAGLLLQIISEGTQAAPAGDAKKGDAMKEDGLTEIRKELVAQKAELAALKEDKKAREQAEKTRQEDATKEGIKALLLPAAQADFDIKHWPVIKQDGFNAWVAKSENAALLAIHQTTGKIEPVGQRFVSHVGADSQETEFDAGIDAAVKGVR